MQDWARNHPWIFALTVALAVCVMVEVALAVQLGRTRARAEKHADILHKMQRLAAACHEKRALIERGNIRLRQPGSLSSIVERVADERKLAKHVGDTKSHPIPHDEFLEQTFELSLTGVRRKDVVNFLRAVEDHDPAIRTKTLRITPNKKQAEFIDAEIRFSAYETLPTTRK